MRQSRLFGLSPEEALGLFVALAAHVAVIAALTMSPLGRKVQPPPQRMTVSFAPTITDQSASPKPDAQPAPDLAPDKGEAAPADQPLPVAVPAPPKPEPKPAPKPKPTPKPEPKPEAKPKPEPKPEPKPIAKPKPAPRVEKPKPKPEPEEAAEAKPKSATKPAHDAKPEHDAKPAAKHEPAKPDKPVGGHQTHEDFKKAFADLGTPGLDHAPPAAKPAAVATADLVSGISRQILPFWKPPSGVDIDKLVVVLAWSLNPDGSLAGNPTVVSESGVNDANRPQADIYAERAIKSVRLAAPFKLPPQAYAQWKHVARFRFDNQLTQQEKR